MIIHMSFKYYYFILSMLKLAYIFCQIWNGEELGVVYSFDKVVVRGY